MHKICAYVHVLCALHMIYKFAMRVLLVYGGEGINALVYLNIKPSDISSYQ